MSPSDPAQPRDRHVDQSTPRRAVELIMGKTVSVAALSAVAVVTARQLGPTGRGEMVVLLTVAALTGLVGTLGVNISGRVLLVARDHPVRPNDYVGLSLVLAACTGAATAMMAWATLVIIVGDAGYAEVLAAGSYGAATVAGYLLIDGLFAFGRTRQAAVCDAIGAVVQLIGVSAVALADVDNIAAFVAAMALGLASQAALSLSLLRRADVPVRPRLRRDSVRLLLRRGAPGMPFLVSQTALYRLDRYLVGILLTPTAVGLYSVGATGAELARFLPAAISQIVFYRIASEQLHPSRLAQTRLTTMAITAVVASVGLVVADPAVVIVFGDEFAPAAGPLRILLLAEVPIAAYYVDTAALTATGHVAAAGLVTVGGLVAVTSADLLMIERLGISGAAWASLAGYTIMAGCAHLVLRRRIVRST